MRRPRLLRLAALAVLVALLAPLTVRWLTHRMLYYPEPGETRTPAAVGLDYRSVSPVAADGVRLSGWWLENPDTEYALVWFHGNAGNLSGRVERVARFFAEGLSVLALDYRGYGLSEGAPTPEGTHADARAAWEFLVGEAGVEPGRIVLLGSSLGRRWPFASLASSPTSPASCSKHRSCRCGTWDARCSRSFPRSWCPTCTTTSRRWRG